MWRVAVNILKKQSCTTNRGGAAWPNFHLKWWNKSLCLHLPLLPLHVLLIIDLNATRQWFYWFFLSASEVDSQLEKWSSYHDFLPFPGAKACWHISSDSDISFPHCNVCIGNLAFAIPAYIYFAPNYWLTFNRQTGHYLMKCTPFSSKRGKFFHRRHWNWIVLWLQQKTVT